MIKSGLKNFFVNLKYYFTPVGILAISMIMAVSVIVPVIMNSVSEMFEKISAIISSTEMDFGPIKDSIADSITSLDWREPLQSLKIMFSSEWIHEALNRCLEVLGAELQPYSEQITEAINGVVSTVIAGVVVFFVFSFIGLICGYVLTRFLVRRNIARSNVGKFLLSAVIDSLLTAGLQVFCLWLYALWKPSSFFTTLLSLVLFSVSALTEAYFVHGYKKVDIKRVLNVGTGLKYLLTNFIIFYISIIFLIISVALTNFLTGLFIGFAFVVIAFIVIDLNAESYVLSLIPNENHQ